MSESFVTPQILACQTPSVYGISPARIMEGVAISFSRGSSWPRDWICISCISRRILHHWAIKEASYKERTQHKQRYRGVTEFGGGYSQSYSSTLATSCEELTHWKRLWCWEGLGAGGEGDDRGWDGWMASLTRWTWVWVNSGSWWWTGRPGVLQLMGSQRVGHDWATELNWIECWTDTLKH